MMSLQSNSLPRHLELSGPGPEAIRKQPQMARVQEDDSRFLPLDEALIGRKSLAIACIREFIFILDFGLLSLSVCHFAVNSML